VLQENCDPEAPRTARRSAGSEPVFLWTAAVLPTAAAWLYFVVLRDHPAAPIAYVFAKLIQFLLPVAALVWLARRTGQTPFSRQVWTHRPQTGSLHWATHHRAKWGAVLVGLSTGLLLAGGIVAARAAILRTDPALDQVSVAVAERMATFSLTAPYSYLSFALFLSLVHSALEEYYWRWYLLGGLRERWSATSASVLSSVAFTSHHVVVVAGYVPPDRWPLLVLGSLGVFLAGMTWAWLYLDRRGILAPWLSHVVVDLAVLAVGWELVARGGQHLAN
jgi:uncharacterized protein